MGNKMLDAAASTIEGILSRDTCVFFNSAAVGLIGTKRVYLHLGKPMLQEVFLSKTNSILTVKQCGICS
jgi:hypothetical protein